ncbi:unnamed protein product [Boreogadus saida]
MSLIMVNSYIFQGKPVVKLLPRTPKDSNIALGMLRCLKGCSSSMAMPNQRVLKTQRKRQSSCPQNSNRTSFLWNLNLFVPHGSDTRPLITEHTTSIYQTNT